jgi:hypothetical protein
MTTETAPQTVLESERACTHAHDKTPSERWDQFIEIVMRARVDDWEAQWSVVFECSCCHGPRKNDGTLTSRCTRCSAPVEAMEVEG